MNGQPIKIEDADAGDRLDVVLARRVEGVSRRRAQYLVSAGIALINGKAAEKSTRIAAGDEVSLTEPVGPDFVPEPRWVDELETLAENDAARLLYKPRGVMSFGRDAADSPTVAGHLVALYDEASNIGIERRRAGLVNVLEPNISGLLIAAQSQRTFDVIRTHFFKSLARAEITALVTGPARDQLPYVQVLRTDKGVSELRIVLERGPKRLWPVRLTRPLLPQLRALLSPHDLTIVGDTENELARPAVHLGELSIEHRHFSIAGSKPVPADWPLAPN